MITVNSSTLCYLMNVSNHELKYNCVQREKVLSVWLFLKITLTLNNLKNNFQNRKSSNLPA